MVFLCTSVDEVPNSNSHSPKITKKKKKNPSTNLLNGNAIIQSSILSLTNESTIFSLGRTLYAQKFQTKLSSLLPFSTSFISSLAPVPNRPWFHLCVLALFRFNWWHSAFGEDGGNFKDQLS